MDVELRYADLTGQIRDCAYQVYQALGRGFVEKVYENALAIELELNNIHYEQQTPVTVSYRGRIVGEYVADLVIENKIIVELKAAKGVDESHFTQLFNYLKATGHEVGLLINFGPRFTFKRRVFNHSASSVVKTETPDADG